MPCRCVDDHNPNPTQLHGHHIFPKAWGGSDNPSNIVQLCPTGHANVHVLLNQYAKMGRKPGWLFRRKYSKYIRELADRGWNEWSARHSSRTKAPLINPKEVRSAQ